MSAGAKRSKIFSRQYSRVRATVEVDEAQVVFSDRVAKGRLHHDALEEHFIRYERVAEVTHHVRAFLAEVDQILRQATGDGPPAGSKMDVERGRARAH